MARRGDYITLTPPSFIVFVISVLLAVIALLVQYAHVAIPIITRAHAFDALAIAFVVLLAGVLFRGI